MTRSNYRHLTSLILTFLIQGVFAANIVVNTATDDENPGDGKCTLREAVNNANTNNDTTNGDCAAGSNIDVDVIDLINISNKKIRLKLGELFLDDNIWIRGPGANSMFNISGEEKYRIFSVGGTNVKITGITISRGFTKDINWGGGGIIVNQGNLTVDDSKFYFNDAPEGCGGGIANLFGSLIISNSYFYDNSAGHGGAICNFNTAVGVILEKDIIQENKNFSVTINNSSFNWNRATIGGGAIANYGPFSYGTNELKVIGCAFYNNLSDEYGGGVFNSDHSTIVANSTFYHNSAVTAGGGIYHDEAFYKLKTIGSLYVKNSTFSDNSANYGGGIYAKKSSTPFNYLNFFLGNTIIAHNLFTSAKGSDCSANGNFQSINNLVGDGSCNPTYSGRPYLSPPRNHGGLTMTHALLRTNPLMTNYAIDTGDDTICTTEPVNGLDQRGASRTGTSAGIHCDIGAFELQTSDLATPTVVKLTEFTAIPTNEKSILFKWETGVERYSAGFYLWQAEPLKGNCEQFTHEIKLTDKAIPSQGNENSGAHYEYRYEGLVNTPSSCYGLEERETSGKRNFYVIGPGIEKWKTFSIE